jgi:holo-[acyl-carrier protein] synthase
MILGTGIDIVEVGRIRRMIERHGDRFVARVFTPEEAAYCRGRAAPATHFAARFAAKEAVAKALHMGFAEGVNWRDIEIIRDERGQPGIALKGEADRLARQMGASAWHLSISHCEAHAIACVVAERG